MVELLFVACLMNAPSDCSERSLVFTGITPQMCMMGAQPQLAMWSATHPNYSIKQWKCQDVAMAGQKA